MSEPSNAVAVSLAHFQNYPGILQTLGASLCQKSINEPVVSRHVFVLLDHFHPFPDCKIDQNRIIYGSQKTSIPHQRSVAHPVRWVFSTSSTAPILGRHCCPHQESPRNMAMAQGLKGSNMSFFFFFFFMRASHIKTMTQPYPTTKNILQKRSDHAVIVELQPTGCFRQVEPLHDANVTDDSGR